MTIKLFLELAERQMAAPVKARIRASETHRTKREQQRDEEQQRLSAYYHARRRQELDDALAGADGAKLQALIEQLDALTLEKIPQLSEFVRAHGWHTAAAATLFIARRLAGESIMKLREKNGLAPFDDPLPGDPATPEQDLRNAFADNSEHSVLDHKAGAS